MPHIDQFESVFKAADKRLFERETIRIAKVLIVTDLEGEVATAYDTRIRAWFQSLHQDPDTVYQLITGDQFTTVASLIQQVQDSAPDLICMYRNLHSPASDFPYSLGIYVDVMTQATQIPVLIMPHPDTHDHSPAPADAIDRVMAITDHLAGDHRLVNYAASITPAGGCLYLSHVEDRAAFHRYMQTIGKIPAIDTAKAEAGIMDQLLKEPREYIESCRQEFSQQRIPLEVQDVVVLGHRMQDYQRLIEEHGIDLLVMNTKDDDQLAMHGLAYPLAVELRQLPLLLV